MLKRLIVFLFLMGLVVACGEEERNLQPLESENAGNNTTEVSNNEPVAEISMAEGEFGRNENGTYFRGAENAPVTLYDYSDFL